MGTLRACLLQCVAVVACVGNVPGAGGAVAASAPATASHGSHTARLTLAGARTDDVTCRHQKQNGHT